MTDTYKLAYPVTGAVINAKLVRDGVLLETVTELTEIITGIYEKASAYVWQDGDDLVYDHAGTIVASTTHRVYNLTRWNSP